MVTTSRETGGRNSRHALLSHDLLHGLPPEEFGRQSESLNNLADGSKARLRAELEHRLETPVDAPSWGPEWIKDRDEKRAPATRARDAGEEADPSAAKRTLIAKNLERSRQVHHFRWLYAGTALFALSIAVLAMFVDYQIIRGDVWTRALSNEFMTVPDSLQASVVFKSMQVLFAVLIMGFFLKISGTVGRNAMIVGAFVMSLVMIGSLGYLVAYNNLAGATSATYDNTDHADQAAPQGDSINRLLATADTRADSSARPPAPKDQETDLGVPKISKNSLANADSWIWFAFASVIFFIVSTVAALYLIMFEHNLRNMVLARDYPQRRRHLTQLHMLDGGQRQAA